MSISNPFFCNFDNQTLQTWTMAVYQTLPSSAGLDSVSWKQASAPQGGKTGVQWDVSFNVALADYQQTGGIGVYTASQTLDATLGTTWNIVFQDNVQQLQATNIAAPQSDQIIIVNNSGKFANPGIGMSGQGSVFKHDVAGKADAQFVVTPAYFVALFDDVELGTVISSNVTVGPLPLIYPSGNNSATLTASMDGENINLGLTYSRQAQTSGVDVANRRAKLEQLRKAA